MKSQLKFADKLGAEKVVIVGPDELADGRVKVRDMETRKEYSIAIEFFRELCLVKPSPDEIMISV